MTPKKAIFMENRSKMQFSTPFSAFSWDSHFLPSGTTGFSWSMWWLRQGFCLQNNAELTSWILIKDVIISYGVKPKHKLFRLRCPTSGLTASHACFIFSSSQRLKCHSSCSKLLQPTFKLTNNAMLKAYQCIWSASDHDIINLTIAP